MCTPNSSERHEELKAKFSDRFSRYVGDELPVGVVNVNNVQNCSNQLKRGKAPGLDGLMVEHIIFAHPIYLCIYHCFSTLH